MPIPLSARIAALLAGPLKGQGWCTPEKGNDLALAILKTKASVVVEIGVLYGSSLLPMAMACAEQKRGIVIGIDPWSAGASIEGADPVNAEWWGKQNHEAIYQTFLAHIQTQGLEQYVRVIRSKSDEVTPPDEIDVLHVDGNHFEQAVRDIERFAPHVTKSGFVFIDDLEWSSGAPRRAADNLLAMGFVQLFKRDTGAMFQRDAPKPSSAKRGRPPGAKNKKRKKKNK